MDTTASAAAADSGRWVVSPRGVGRLRIGMTVGEATAALGGALVVSPGAASPSAECDYATWRGGPPGLAVMIEGGRVVRVDIDSGDVATTEGARVGDTEDRIRELYAGRLRVDPHKYTDGKYLTVTPAAPADSQYALVFETDRRGRVTEFRAGVWPPVGYVERCG